jgi:hypothetical protein
MVFCVSCQKFIGCVDASEFSSRPTHLDYNARYRAVSRIPLNLEGILAEAGRRRT